MFFLSRLIGNDIFDSKGVSVGKVKDFSVSLTEGYPPIKHIVCKGSSKDDIRIRWNSVRSFEESQIFLSCPSSEIQKIEKSAEEVDLASDVLDRQIFDTEDRKLIRVQDVQMARVEGQLLAMAVDVSIRAVVRRLGFENLVSGFKEKLQPKLIDWKKLSFIGVEEHNIKLKVQSKDFEILHPADIADIVSELSPEQRTEILTALDDEIAADTIEELDPQYQASTIAGLESKRASEILEEMSPDEAADLIADLPETKAQELLGLMSTDEAYEIRQLLQFPEDSAGGIMTTEFVTVREDFTISQTIKIIRERGDEIDTMSYIYVVDMEGVLKGVFSLLELIMAEPQVKVKNVMQKNVISVGLLMPQVEVAKLVAKYDILAIPVIDDKKRIKGIVTIDDALDVIIPTKWKKRLPRIY